MSVRERILTIRLLERLSADPNIATDLGLELTHDRLPRDNGEDLPAKQVVPRQG